MLCPAHAAWACSGLGIEFLPLKRPSRGQSKCDKRQRGCMEEVEAFGEGSVEEPRERSWEVRLRQAEPWAPCPASRNAPWCHWSVGRSLWVHENRGAECREGEAQRLGGRMGRVWRQVNWGTGYKSHYSFPPASLTASAKNPHLLSLQSSWAPKR